MFVLAFELLDNLPHDKVMFDDNGQPWEAVIVPRDTFATNTLRTSRGVMDFVLSDTLRERQRVTSDTERELFRPAEDPLILKTMAMLEESEEKLIAENTSDSLMDRARSRLGFAKLRYSKTGALTPASAVRAKQAIAYIPTGQLRFLEALKRCFPRHSLILSDFDSLPGLVMKGAGGPVVQSVDKKNHICDRSHYLLPPDISADIFFPTDFDSLKCLYEHITGNSAGIQPASEFFKPFEESVKKCRTMSGYCPLTEYYSNTSYFVGRPALK